MFFNLEICFIRTYFINGTRFLCLNTCNMKCRDKELHKSPTHLEESLVNFYSNTKKLSNNKKNILNTFAAVQVTMLRSYQYIIKASSWNWATMSNTTTWTNNCIIWCDINLYISDMVNILIWISVYMPICKVRSWKCMQTLVLSLIVI